MSRIGREKPRKDFADTPTADYGVDLGPAAQARSSRIVSVGGERKSAIKSVPVTVRRYTCECYLDELHAHQRVTDRQWKAGMLFRGKWLIGARHTPVTALYGSRTDTRNTATATEHAHSARQQLTDAIKHLGQWRSAVVIAICGEDEQRPEMVPPLVWALDMLGDFWAIDPRFERE